MKVTRESSGAYTVTGHTQVGQLVQYTITREGSGWHTIGWLVRLVSGSGQPLNQRIFATKAQAVQAITDQ